MGTMRTMEETPCKVYTIVNLTYPTRTDREHEDGQLLSPVILRLEIVGGGVGDSHP